MGLHRHSIAFAVAARQAGVDYDRTLTLARQGLVAGDERPLTTGFRDAGSSLDKTRARQILAAEGGFSEPLFRHLGASRVDSVDATSYENATYVHDLNQPLPDEFHGRYSTVVDGGTLEHVFEFPTALRSALEAVEVGGHYLAFTPSNNFFGHGFYQLSPELYFRALSPENGYRVRCMLLRGYNLGARWYQVPDPAEVGHRVIALSAWPADLYILAQRVEAKEVCAVAPQQSDYESSWQGAEAPAPAAPSAKRALRRGVGRAEPLAAKDLRFTLRTALFRHERRAFRRVDVADVPALAGATP